LGSKQPDIVIVTGDAYVDHPSFGAALIRRLLESQDFTVEIIAQPDWKSAKPFMSQGMPQLMFAVTSGNMDSMVNHYTADGKKRSKDAYSPDGQIGKRPDRALIVYANRCREAYSGVPVIIGGIEASLRRFAHYDYWSDKVRRSVLLDSKADLLLYGNAERAVVEVAKRLSKGESIKDLTDVRQTAFSAKEWDKTDAVVLPAFDVVKEDKQAFAVATKLISLHARPRSDRTLVQPHGDRQVVMQPAAKPLTTAELDRIYDLPYTRKPHPSYKNKSIPAWEMIKFSVNIHRGCYGGCSFCSLVCHEGDEIQSRSKQSVIKEIEAIRDLTPGFTGIISDLGGPSANMYMTGCRDKSVQAKCQRSSCLYPKICKQLEHDPTDLIKLYRKARKVRGVKKVLVASGIRHDLAVLWPKYIQELAAHHVGGHLKLAPEHTQPGPLSAMQKPDIETLEQFKKQFDKFSKKAGLEQYLVLYFIAAHPGTTDEDMLQAALWLKKQKIRPQQVQTFLPSPMSIATAMYYTGLNPLKPKTTDKKNSTTIPRGLKIRRLHKAFLLYHDPKNWPLIRKALVKMGLEDFVGSDKVCLVPSASAYKGKRRKKR